MQVGGKRQEMIADWEHRWEYLQLSEYLLFEFSFYPNDYEYMSTIYYIHVQEQCNASVLNNETRNPNIFFVVIMGLYHCRRCEEVTREY